LNRSLAFLSARILSTYARSGQRLAEFSYCWASLLLLKEATMNKDRLVGTAKEAKGTVKEMAGKVIGDTSLESTGKIDRLLGRIQRTFGGLRDAIRGK
jgi:uncharacterized protein YjbJ (UPF0337 family)